MWGNLVKKEVLKFDFSNKSLKEMAQFASIFLSVKRTLCEKHGLNVIVLPKQNGVQKDIILQKG